MSDVLITPASSQIEIKNGSNITTGLINLNGSDQLTLSSSRVMLRGHVTASVYSSSVNPGVGFFGTASYALSTLSSSFASGSNVTARSSSYALSASYAITASYALTSSRAITASNALTASYSLSSSFVGSGTNNYVPKWSSNTLTGTSLVFDNGSGVGIGTTTVLNAELVVHGGSLGGTSGDIITMSIFSTRNSNGSFLDIYERRFQTGGSWETAATRIQKRTDVTNQAYIEFNPTGSAYGLAIGAGIGGLSETEVIRITGDTFCVGIGTTNPSSKLHVLRTSEQLRLGYDANNYNSFTVGSTGLLTLSTIGTSNSLLANYTSSTFGSENNVASSINIKRNNVVVGGMTTANTVFSLFGGSSAANHLTINSIGNVGIGTTTPATKLNIIGSTTIGGKNLTGSHLLIGTETSGIGIDTNEIYQNGDELYIGTLDDGRLIFRPSSTDVMSITGSGRVGIMTFVPNYSLDIYGNLRTTASAFFATSTGSVGIGTTDFSYLLNSYLSPTNKFNILSFFDSGPRGLHAVVGSWNGSYPLFLYEASHSNAATRNNEVFRIHSNEAGANSKAFRITTQNTVTAPEYEAITVDYIGQVGMGTTNPTAKLDVSGSLYVHGGANGTTLALFTRTDGGTGQVGIYATHNEPVVVFDSDNDTNNFWAIGESATYNFFGFQFCPIEDTNFTGSQTKMILTQEGNLGLGPQAALTSSLITQNIHVRTSQSAVLQLDADIYNVATTAGEGSTPQIRLTQDGGISTGYVGLIPTNNSFVFGVNSTTTPSFHFVTGNTGTSFVSSSAAAVFSITNTGNVGIGSTAPSEKLHVSGSNPYGLIDVSLIGNFGFSNYAGFGHRDLKDKTTAYAILQGSDGETFINSSGSRPIHFRLGNADKMYLDTTGNFGIGPNFTSPSTLLHLSSSSSRMRLQSGTDPVIQYVGPATHSYSFGLDTTDNFLKLDYAASATPPTLGTNTCITINTSKNVGINTSTIYTKFQVNGDIGVQNVTDKIGYTDTDGADVYMTFDDNNSTVNIGTASFSHGGGFKFIADRNTNNKGNSYIQSLYADILAISSSVGFFEGQVGIGTRTHSASLSIRTQQSSSTVLNVEGTAGTLFTVIDDLSDSLLAVNNSSGLPIFEVFNNNDIVAGEYGENDFVVTENKVGIGTNAPSEKLDVAKDTDVSGIIGKAHIGYLDYVDQAGFGHIDSATSTGYALMQSSSGETFINAAVNETINFGIQHSYVMKIQSKGVGIAANPSDYNKLIVTGNTYLNGELSSSATTSSVGGSGGKSWDSWMEIHIKGSSRYIAIYS